MMSLLIHNMDIWVDILSCNSLFLVSQYFFILQSDGEK